MQKLTNRNRYSSRNHSDTTRTQGLTKNGHHTSAALRALLRISYGKMQKKIQKATKMKNCKKNKKQNANNKKLKNKRIINRRRNTIKTKNADVGALRVRGVRCVRVWNAVCGCVVCCVWLRWCWCVHVRVDEDGRVCRFLFLFTFFLHFWIFVFLFFFWF